MATGEQFPDALSGGTHVGTRGGPVVLSRSTSVPDSTMSYLQGDQPHDAYLYGGDVALNNDVDTCAQDVVAGQPC
jgi:hypothetical protein